MARDVKMPLAACFACAAALGLVTVLALGVEAGRHIDVRLFLRLVEHHPKRGTWGEAIASVGNPLPVLALLAGACAVALPRGRAADALAALVVVAGGDRLALPERRPRRLPDRRRLGLRRPRREAGAPAPPAERERQPASSAAISVK